MTRIIHTAQALVDVVVEVPALPAAGGNVMAESLHRYAGGAVTTLLAAARTGVVAVHAGSVGTGENGDLVRGVLAGDGIALSSPPVAGLDTGICLVLIDPDGERTFITTSGAERRVSVASLATSEPEPGDVVCLSGYSFLGAPREPLLSWLDGLDDAVTVVLDPGAVFPDLPDTVRHRVLARTTVWTSNAGEATAITGRSVPGDTLAAIAALLPAGAGPGGAPVVVVRDGPRGCHVLAGGTTAYLPGHPQEPVDTNGAGDTHTGVLLGERALGADWFTAAARANIAAAITVTRRGPSTAPTRAEVDAFVVALT